MSKRIRIVERKLGRERACGQSWGDGLVEIDSRLDAREYLLTLVHELAHEADADLSEETVVELEQTIGGGLWQAGYRLVRLK